MFSVRIMGSSRNFGNMESREESQRFTFLIASEKIMLVRSTNFVFQSLWPYILSRYPERSKFFSSILYKSTESRSNKKFEVERSS